MSDNTEHNRPLYHRGETRLQRELGVMERMAIVGRRAVRDHLPVQHHELLAELPYLVIGASDASDRPWAALLGGEPGFIRARDERSVEVRALPHPLDPLSDALQPGSLVGLLAIDLQSRRRNRISGTVVERHEDRFAFRVDHTIGNCPKYIQLREVVQTAGQERIAADTGWRFSRLEDVRLTRLIENADTLFIASQALDEGAAITAGVDVSHRGGRPGFVKMETDQTLVFPDFIGNSVFMTLGNLEVDPRAGLLFIDFEHGHVVTLTGQATIERNPAVFQGFKGALRAIRFELDEGHFLPGALPLRWRLEGQSPYSEATGTWAEAERSRTLSN